MRKNQPLIKKTTLGTRLYFVVPGMLLIAFSILAVSREVWWIPGFSERLGHERVTPVLTFGVLGIVFLGIGLFPWNRLGNNQK